MYGRKDHSARGPHHFNTFSEGDDDTCTSTNGLPPLCHDPSHPGKRT